MKYRSLAMLLLAFALVFPSAFAEDNAPLIVGGDKPFLHKSPVVIDGEVYATLPALNAIGARYSTDIRRKEDGQKIEITAASGDRISVKARLIDGELMVPMRELAPELGAVATWNPASKTLSLRADLKEIKFDGSELRVRMSYPVTYKVTWWSSARKLILDINGVNFPSKPEDVPVTNSTDVPIRAAQQTDGRTGRVVLDMPCTVKWRTKSMSKASEIVVSVSGLENAPEQDDTATDQAPRTETAPMDSAQQTPQTPPVAVTDVSYRKDGSRKVDVYVSASGSAKYETSLTRDPDQLMVDIKNAILEKEFDDIYVGHELLDGVHVQPYGSDVRVILDLKRIVGFDVKRNESSRQFTISLVLPKGAGGSLAGKTIVIDPGHGGSATGAKGLDGLLEKHSNFAIASRVKKLLMDAGVCVVMTRDGDYSLGSTAKADLENRAACAAKHSADAFLSIHSNSISGPRCPSGLETYYHGYDMNGKALAYCVHSEITKGRLLPDLRVRSDFMLYQTGLGVLRNASERHGIPSALIEVGYVKHPEDLAKLRSSEFQQKVAEAIVRGFKEYFEGHPKQQKSEIVQPVAHRPGSVGKPEVKRAVEASPPSGRTVTKPVETKTSAAPKPVEPEKKDEPTDTDGPRRPGERRQ